MSDYSKLQKYRSHKVVEAAKVLDTFQHDKAIIVLEHNGESVTIHPSDSWWDRFHVADRQYVGGYYVRYEDGYDSWSPADVFEEGYTLLAPDAPA